MTKFKNDINKTYRAKLITDIQKGYDQLERSDFISDENGNYPKVGNWEGKG